MARPIEQELYRSLMASQFDFIERGVIDIGEIYDEVHLNFRHLCDDDYMCSENCSGNKNQPEWKHRVQTALGYLKTHSDKIHKFPLDGFWEFT